MSRTQRTIGQSLFIVSALTLAVSGTALADDSSMRRLGGDSYAYFDRQPVTAAPGWRLSHPKGISEQELQALSSSDLSAAASRLNPPVFARASADPSWRATHPSGLTERELRVLSSSSLAIWQSPSRSELALQRNAAGIADKESFAAR